MNMNVHVRRLQPKQGNVYISGAWPENNLQNFCYLGQIARGLSLEGNDCTTGLIVEILQLYAIDKMLCGGKNNLIT